MPRFERLYFRAVALLAGAAALAFTLAAAPSSARAASK